MVTRYCDHDSERIRHATVRDSIRRPVGRRYTDEAGNHSFHATVRHDPVVVVANALHDPSDHNIGDAFAVTIAFVGDNSFDSPAKGWSQNLYLSWFATNVGGSTF